MRAMTRRPLAILISIGAIALLGIFSAVASAAPGAYKVLLAESYPEQPKRLAAQVAAFPDVAVVDMVNTGNEAGVTPTATQLAGYDIVVSIGDSSYLDSEAWGESLASYVDAGGVVVVSAYDTWENSDPLGRFATGGYLPVTLGDNVNDPKTLGAFDPANPLMQGVGPLFSSDNTANLLTPGASLVASWNDGSIAIAGKSRVLAITGFIGDHYGEEIWSGNYGRVIVNTVRTVGNQLLSVSVSNAAGGTVTSSAGGLNCGPVCSAILPAGTPVSLSATAAKGFAFGGFGGPCAGSSCALTMDGPKAVTAAFVSFGLGKKVKLNKATGKGTLTLNLGAPGKLVLSGKKVKKQTKSPKKAGKVKLPIVAKGKALAKLENTGKAKVKFKLAYTPTGGTQATKTKSVVLKLNP
ncbi:MAG: hypothetical protein QOE75_1387 [Solirubrobacterales bacterium]|jgi:hypothetical protein|nr:hypothetical protein [Solirubrobacterales bacterium]